MAASDTVGEITGTVQLLLITGILAGLGIAGYYLYQWYQNNSPTDPNTGQPVGPLNAVDNFFFPTSNPGGGETINTAETYTGAVSEELSDPIGVIKSIFGFN